MNAFSAAMDAIFDDPNMAVDAFWEVAGVPPMVPCRLMLKRPDDVMEFGGAVIVSGTILVDVRVSEIAAPAAGDVVTIGAERFRVQGKPRRDRERLVWMTEIVPK